MGGGAKDGLRNVLVYVWQGGHFPPERDSPADIELVRAANRSLRRASGAGGDAILFVVVGSDNETRVAKAVENYGFSGAAVALVPDTGGQGRMLFSEDEFEESIGDAISRWLSGKHPGAIPATLKDEKAAYWWTGVESFGDPLNWPFTIEHFARELPVAHQPKAETWLAVLAATTDVADALEGPYLTLAQDAATAWAATLCTWLYGFEAALEDDADSFVDAYEPGPCPSDFYLGFELARLSGEWIEAVCDERGDDLDELPGRAMRKVVQDRRGELTYGLKTFFEGGAGLFWTLYSTTRPDYSLGPGEWLQRGLDLEDEAMEPLVDAWRFVESGWFEEAGTW